MLRILPAILLIFGTYSSVAQESIKHTHPDEHFRKGIELFEKSNYVSAQKHFILASKASNPNEYHLKGEAEFYNALCAIELFNDDAEYLIRTFINKFPDNQKVNVAYFELAKLRYREKKYEDAIYWFGKTNKNGLGSEQRAEFLFKLGYSHFVLEEFEPAGRAFFEIKDIKNRYAGPATYYYAHIAYANENYATALKGFQKLSDDKTFATLVPYYITQILYLQRQYDKVVEYAPPILESASARRTPEIARLIGESLYRLRQYEKAIPFIEQYVEKSENLSRADNYLVGFVYYRNNKIDEAIKYLERVAVEEDSLSQNAYYHLADCYLKLDQKDKARQAFSLASKHDFDMSVKEDALFNFAKITYETLYNPFNEAIEAFQSYIELFPNSTRIDEAHNYLVMAYSNTKNYKEALASLNQIVVKDASIRRAYQRVAFYRGIELFQNLNFLDAIDKFSLSLKYPEYSQTLSALAMYWRGESYYRLEDFEKAANDYNQFLLSSGAFDLPEYNMAHYNLGYAYFKLEKYQDAIVWLRKFANLNHDDPSQLLGDAYNRIADSYFIQRRYWVALDYYEHAINTNAIDVDYAILQRGISFGLVDRPQKKIDELKKLTEQFDDSKFLDDALFELAETSLSLNQNKEAVRYYERIKDQFPGSSYFVKALVQLGIAAYNQEDNESAMQYYKRVVEEFPESPEAKNALVGIKNIYVDIGEADSYFTYASKLGSLGSVTMAEKDSLSYIAAERIYMNGDCQKAIQKLSNYLEEFPRGNFVLNARFYKGDCLQKTGETEAALDEYTHVIQRKKNPFTEQTLLAASEIYMSNKRYAEAYEVYSLLESMADIRSNLLVARVGMLRSANKLNRHQDVIDAAAKVLISDKLPTETEREARFLKAKSLLEQNRNDSAFDEFAHVSSNLRTEEGAEAKYRMIRIYYDSDQLDKAEEEVFSFADENTPHQFWLAKSFIVLADIYAQRDDFFQSKATLQSIIDGYANPDDGIVDEALEKMASLVKEEKGKQESSDSDTINLEWN
ncbi:MAG: tetratricopeptide repeat protein [Bacteroidales bacterium]